MLQTLRGQEEWRTSSVFFSLRIWPSKAWGAGQVWRSGGLRATESCPNGPLTPPGTLSALALGIAGNLAPSRRAGQGRHGVSFRQQLHCLVSHARLLLRGVSEGRIRDHVA